MAKRPIADAAWKSVRPGIYQNYAKAYEDRLAKMGLKAEQFGLDWPELALRFALSFPDVSTAIVGTTDADHARANLATAARGALSAETIEAIRAAFKRADPDGKWLGQT